MNGDWNKDVESTALAIGCGGDRGCGTDCRRGGDGLGRDRLGSFGHRRRYRRLSGITSRRFHKLGVPDGCGGDGRTGKATGDLERRNEKIRIQLVVAVAFDTGHDVCEEVAIRKAADTWMSQVKHQRMLLGVCKVEG